MRTRGALSVGLSLLVLLAGIGAVGAAFAVPASTQAGSGDPVASSNSVAGSSASDAAQYKVSLDDVTVRTWLLRDSTVRNATVERVVVENVTTPAGARENVTLLNVTVGRFDIERGRLTNVTASRLVIRNRSVLDVPGGDLFDPKVENRTLNRQWTRNATVAGVVIDRLTVDAAFLCGNASLGERAENADAFDPQGNDDPPAVTVRNGTVEEALLMRGAASNWSVRSVEEPPATNASLPRGCNRG